MIVSTGLISHEPSYTVTMSAKQRPDDPEELTWVKLKNPVAEHESNAKVFCSFIEKFLYRPNDNKPNELFIVINSDSSSKKRYKYLNVPRSVFEEAWRRAFKPDKFNVKFGSWFGTNIRDKYEYERFEE